MKPFREMTVSQIRSHLSGLKLEGTCRERVMEALVRDDRKSVRDLAEIYERKLWKARQEELRFERMLRYEKALRHKGIRIIAGIDEVGRGPLAGPVVSAAVVLPEAVVIPGLNDSKKVSEKHRKRLYGEIVSKATAVSVGMATPEEIDEWNILEAAKASMRRALQGLSVPVEHVLVDALTLGLEGTGETAVIKGDEKSVSIAAASIVAKVVRDNLMIEMEERFPGYAFIRNKGYGTAEHLEALRAIGPSPIHRRSFMRGILGGDDHQ